MSTERVHETQEETSRRCSVLEELIDLEFEESCALEGDENVTLDEVRKATASISGSMAETIIEEERADRF